MKLDLNVNERVWPNLGREPIGHCRDRLRLNVLHTSGSVERRVHSGKGEGIVSSSVSHSVDHCYGFERP